MRSIVFGGFSIGVAVVLATACGSGSAGQAGPAGAAGPAGSAGPPGAAGPAGAGADGGAGESADATTDGSVNQLGPVVTSTLSAHAQIGLASAPVPLALAGKTTAELEQIGEGAYIVSTQAACPDCHSKTPAPANYLAGGVVIPIGPNMSVVSRNLTPDQGTGLKDTVGQYIQATRNGTDTLNGNSALIVHPWQYERWMGTDDLEAIYSYLRVIPAVSNTYAQDVKPQAPGETFPGVYNEGAAVRPLPPEFDGMDASIPDPDHILRGTAVDPLAVAPPDDADQAALFGRGSYLVNAVIGCSACHTHPDRNYMSPTQAVNTGAFLAGGIARARGGRRPLDVRKPHRSEPWLLQRPVHLLLAVSHGDDAGQPCRRRSGRRRRGATPRLADALDGVPEHGPRRSRGHLHVPALHRGQRAHDGSERHGCPAAGALLHHGEQLLLGRDVQRRDQRVRRSFVR
jgi:hypothetical protein